MYEQRKKDLVEGLQDANILHDPRIERAFLMVPLEEFIPERDERSGIKLRDDERLYADIPQLFYRKSPVDVRTISAPHMITICMEYLNLRSTDTLLFLGSKSGYMEAIASLLCSEGHVYVVEGSEEILELTRANLKKTGFGENVSLIHGNPLTMAGTESLGTWDKILIPYQVEEPDVYPALRQLNDCGVLFAPIGTQEMQYFTQIIKKDGTCYGNRISTVLFAPLEKNVTYLSQQVQFLQLVKKIKKQVDLASLLEKESSNDDQQQASNPFLDIKYIRPSKGERDSQDIDEQLSSFDDTELDAKIQSAEAALQARKLQATRDAVRIIYDSPIGDQLCETYKQETMVSDRDEGPDFKVIEDFAVQLALQHGGTVRVVTIMNEALPRWNPEWLTFETIKLYLKRSTQGKLVGDMNDARALKFELNDARAMKDPMTANIIKDLALHLDTADGLLNDDTMPEFKDMVQYFIDKLDFLGKERKEPAFRSAALIARQLLEHVAMLEAAAEGTGDEWQATRQHIQDAIRDGMKELRSAIERF